MIVISRSLVLSDIDIPEGTPWIGYHNIVTANNIVATTEDAGFPVTNLANAGTHLLWKSLASPTEDQFITVTTGYLEEIDYLAVAKHNFGSQQAILSVEGSVGIDAFTKVLLPFTGADGSTTFTDTNLGGSAHTWTASGNAQIDTAQSKFGDSSGLFDGTGDVITTPDHADFTLGSGDWTVDFWFNCNAAGGTVQRLAGQGNSIEAVAETSFAIRRTAANVIQAYVAQGAVTLSCTGTTQFTDAINTGWHHCAFVRTGTSLKLFIDGVQEGSTTAITGAINNSTSLLAVGSQGAIGVNLWTGWIDEFRLSVGIARWTANFTPPDSPHDPLAWEELVQEQMLADDAPVLFRWEPQVLTAVRLRIQATGVVQAGVMYVGKLLVMERGIDINNDHVPIKYGRRSNIVTGMSENGNFLGRIVLGEHRESKAEYAWITPDWYRDELDPFFIASKSLPFFYVWSPLEYPGEIGFCWMINNPEPETDPVTRRVAVGMQMRGVA